MNSGLLSIIIQQLGETETSQFVNAYKASTITLGDVPLSKVMIISTSSAVLSSICFILIFPDSFALIIDCTYLE